MPRLVGSVRRHSSSPATSGHYRRLLGEAADANPRPALIVGKAFAAGIRPLIQVVVLLVVSALGVDLMDNPIGMSWGLGWLGADTSRTILFWTFG